MLPKVLVLFLALALYPCRAAAQNLDLIGVTLLRALATNLDGSGIRVAQAEASSGGPVDVFEVDPAKVNQPGRFSYYSPIGTATSYPNTAGTNSTHAQTVGTFFYSPAAGVATNIAHVDNIDATYIYYDVVASSFSANLNDPIVNQSFMFSGATAQQQQQYDANYDNYAVRCNTLFVSAAGNSGLINPPATCYNGIGVGDCDGPSSHGPTLDNGRSKPDLTAPGGSTSYATPYVTGSAALLLQAALRGDGGADTNSAADMRTLKALLLNGAVKPAGWTNAPANPLDARYGAGVVNAFNSYRELAFGRHPYIVSLSVTSGLPHPPTGATGTISSNNGWDFNTNTSTAAMDSVNHYYFNVSNGVFTATATLVWNRQLNQSGINNLALFLYNAANSNLVAQSTSAVDNVQHIFAPALAPGRYDLQVWKAGGPGIVSSAESYALAWALTAPALKMVKSGTNVILSWPVYPAGYAMQAATLIAPVWGTNNVPGPAFVSGTNFVTLPMTSAVRIFRLQQPGS